MINIEEGHSGYVDVELDHTKNICFAGQKKRNFSLVLWSSFASDK